MSMSQRIKEGIMVLAGVYDLVAQDVLLDHNQAKMKPTRRIQVVFWWASQGNCELRLKAMENYNHLSQVGPPMA